MSTKRLEIILSVDASAAVAQCMSVSGALENAGRAADDAGGSVSRLNRVRLSSVTGEAKQTAGALENTGRVARNSAATGIETFGRKATTSGSRAASALRGVGSALRDVGGQLARVGLQWAKYFALAGVAAATAAGVAVIRLGAKMEQTRLALQVMMGDIARANAMLKQFNRFANVTPFSNSEVISAGKTLLAYGIVAEDVQTALKAVGDIAAGTGKDFTELAAIYGKVSAKGKADTEIINQLSEAGVPIVKELAAQYGITSDMVYKYAEQGKISAGDIRRAFISMTSSGGIYANMMAKQAETVAGKWSTLTGKIQDAAATAGEAVLPIVSLLLDKVMTLADEISLMAENGMLTAYMLDAAAAGVSGFEGLMTAAVGFFSYVGGAILIVYHTIRTVAALALTLVTSTVTGLVAVFEGIFDAAIWAYNKLAPLVGADKVQNDAFSYSRFMGDVTSGLVAETVKSGVGIAADVSMMYNTPERQETVRRTFAPLKSDLAELLEKMRAETTARRDNGAETQTENLSGAAPGAALSGVPDYAEPVAELGRSAPALARSENAAGEVDSLARIGLYNNNAESLLGQERNRILRAILNRLDNSMLTLNFSEA